MDSQAFEAGRRAYQNGDFVQASALLAQAKAPGEINGAVDHLRGNALMRLGLYEDAARAYGDALADESYGRVGALATNRGRAYLAAGQADAAIASLTQALSDASYPTPYKAQAALGEAYERLGQPREAGAAWRNAAIDESNPNPSLALTKLGGCFMQLGRPADAIEAYRTALDFSAPQASQNALYAELGEAYVAANRLTEAADAFGQAMADGTYQLTPNQQAAYAAAANAMRALGVTGRSETDAMLAAAGYGTPGGTGAGAVDPLDPLGSSGEFIPSPEDTGFFEISEQDIVENAKQKAKVERKNKHTGLKVFIALLVIIGVLAACAVGLYTLGYGWPMQEDTVNGLFSASTTGEDPSTYLASGLSEDQIAAIESIIPAGATVTIDGVDRTMNSSTVTLTATLAEGGTQSYIVTLVREGIGWKVSDVQLSFDSLLGDGANSGTQDTTTTDTALIDDGATTPIDDTSTTTIDQTTSDGTEGGQDASAGDATTITETVDTGIVEGENGQSGETPVE